MPKATLPVVAFFLVHASASVDGKAGCRETNDCSASAEVRQFACRNARKDRTTRENVFDLNDKEFESLAIVDRSGNIDFVKYPGLSWFTGVECQF